ncbi:MAG: bifunctional hydroxymethylpyrimidine kinase/phosphomethylpyrimidine kinase [Myxococcota bacterium]|nr:bifunctional hydroxymethylpyrimidine kinase/phosphomethylpyrimidine kinase [Myxococcota bacterium]
MSQARRSPAGRSRPDYSRDVDTPSPLALTIAGSDPSGGAGLQGDINVFSRHGLRTSAVVTALTVQSGRGVVKSEAVPPSLVQEQLERVLTDHRVGGAKVGMLALGETVAAVAAAWKRLGGTAPLVVDPVLRSSSGTALLDPGGVDLLREELLPLATVITPNLDEAAALLGRMSLGVSEAEEAARDLLEMGPKAVVLTGGHAPGSGPVRDVVCCASGEVVFLEGSRIDTEHDHGTGCLLSAGIVSALVLGASVLEAVEHGRRCVRRGLESGCEGAVWLDQAPEPIWL